MPSPLELILDPASLVVFGIYAALIALEFFFPARKLTPVSGWAIRGLVAFAIYFFASSYLPLLWGETISKYQVIDMKSLGTFYQVATGVLIYELGTWAWHITMHKNDILWRLFHQLHHSAERIDTYGAFYFSPFDILGWTALSSLCLTVCVGLTPVATTYVLWITTFMGIFQHTNIRTPRWLGYILQRPESHSLHHGRGVHGFNYSDLPLFDLVFGTFRNPESFEKENGYYDGASSRVVDMLLFRDVSRP